jgi:clan AA aspartic protease (TIGR02281 family)
MLNCVIAVNRLSKALIISGILLAGPRVSLPNEFYRWVDQNGVVHFTDNLHNIPQNYREGATRIKAKESPRTQATSRAAPTTKASIPIVKRGEVAIVQATINQKTPATLIVDTGASYTMISSATAKQLEIEIEKNGSTFSFQTANGVIQAPLVKLDSIEIGGMEVKNLTAAVHDALPDPSISGLLGLNFLSNFRLDFDTQKGFLHLEKK